MIIDSHTHVQRVDGFWDSPPERILELMDSAGIDMSVIMPYSDSPSLVDYTADSARLHPRLIPYARLNPGDPGSLQLLEDGVRKLGVRGLKLHPVGNHVHPAQAESLELISLAADLGIPTLFHCGDEEFTLPLQVAAAARALPDAMIIMGHMGGYFHTNDAIEAAVRWENIYLETSAMPYPGVIHQAVKRIGSRRVLFASDGPGCPPDLELLKVKMAGLDRDQLRKVMGENIAELLKISPGEFLQRTHSANPRKSYSASKL